MHNAQSKGHDVAIDDPRDARLDAYRDVADAARLEQNGIFVAEGRLVVERLLTGNRLVTRSVLVSATARAALDSVLAVRPDVPVYVVAQAVIETITGFNIHRGCLAIGERPAPVPWQRLAARSKRLIVLEQVGNPDNMGGIFRNAAALGGDGVLLGPACADPLYRKSIRTSMAAALRVPFASITSWPQALRELGDLGFEVIGLAPAAPGALRDVVQTRSPNARIALTLGHEGHGLTPEALGACSRLASIPMTPGSDSLNVAAACAIALYELHR